MKTATGSKRGLKPNEWLTKGGFARDDSDDELGDEDIPWQWISADSIDAKTETPSRSLKRKAAAISTDQENDTTKARRLPSSKCNIIGARIGGFEVHIGDAVLLKSPEAGKDWAGLICAFGETNEDNEEEMCANIQWFASADELAQRGGTGKSEPGKKFPPHLLRNETFVTADFNWNALTAINGKATIMSPEAFLVKYPGGRLPKGASRKAQMDFAKTVICRRGVRQRTLQFTEEFMWEEKYRGPGDLYDLLTLIETQTRRKNNRKRAPLAVLQEDEYMQEDNKWAGAEEDVDDPITPRKKYKTSSTTPRSSVKSAKFTTPTHKRTPQKKPLTFTPLGTRLLTTPSVQSSPYTHARSTLHVSAVPSSLPCREDEFSTIYTHLYNAITENSGSTLYISGVPGTGKTATVREVISSLGQSVDTGDLDPFTFVEINGLKITEPMQAYSMLWSAVKGAEQRVSPSHALSLLNSEFSTPRPGRVPVVVLMDELDQLVTKNQAVMYNFFNWPSLRHSRLIVLAVANTMDLPERTLSNKINSRLGLVRISFAGYDHGQLMEIIRARLEGIIDSGGRCIVENDAVQFAARKVAAVSGDARRCLDICRRAVEIAESEQNRQTEDDPMPTPDTPSKVRKPDHSLATGKSTARVTIATIRTAINEATSSPMSQALRALPLASKIFLAALLARTRRTGVAESTYGDVLIEAKRIADVADNEAVKEFLLVDGKNSLPRVHGMGAAATELQAAGVVAMEAKWRGERSGKLRLRIGDEDVKSALATDPEVKGMGFNA